MQVNSRVHFQATVPNCLKLWFSCGSRRGGVPLPRTKYPPVASSLHWLNYAGSNIPVYFQDSCRNNFLLVEIYLYLTVFLFWLLYYSNYSQYMLSPLFTVCRFLVIDYFPRCTWKAVHRSHRMILIFAVSCIHYAVCSPCNCKSNHKQPSVKL